MLAKRIREVRGRTQAGQPYTRELGNSVDVTQETLDSSASLTVKNKRKKPLNDIKSSPNGVLSGKNEGGCEGYYEVVSDADLPAMYVVPAQHSCTIVKENRDLELAGAVLNPMNEYDIYAPETMQERERRRQTMWHIDIRQAGTSSPFWQYLSSIFPTLPSLGIYIAV